MKKPVTKDGIRSIGSEPYDEDERVCVHFATC